MDRLREIEDRRNAGLAIGINAPELRTQLLKDDVPYLIAEVRQLRKDNEQLREERNTFMLRLNRLDKVIEPLVDRLHEQIDMARRGILPDQEDGGKEVV